MNRKQTAVHGFVLAMTLVAATSVAQVGKNQGLLNPNLASADELAALPHMTDQRADHVVAGRPWLSMAELHAILGTSLDEEQQAELYAKLWLPINLNTAASAEIDLIPGVGRRMIHEFEEYRPYAALAQFRREIGKYVDDEELARLEQYVFVPLDLNTASEEDLHTIPGVGDRLVHEFLEYRPYHGMEQFRREIGKYVDEAEVTRLERYLTLGEH